MPIFKRQYKKRFLSLFTALIISLFVSGSCFADTTTETGIFTDNNDFRWEYNLTTTTTSSYVNRVLKISFYDKPSDASTVIVPSYEEVLSHFPDVPSNINTYWLVDGNVSQQDQNYGTTYTRRAPAVETTKLDLSNTNKIQIQGVEPIINPDVETELVFGPGIVIADGQQAPLVSITPCIEGTVNHYWEGSSYYCTEGSDIYVDVPNYRRMTPDERANFVVTYENMGYHRLRDTTDLNFNPSYKYATWLFGYPNGSYLGAFEGYKLKLTNFEGSNFNYVGWKAFANTAINGQTVTISGNAFKGGNIFKGSNLTTVNLNTDTAGSGLFRDNKQLTTVNIAANVTTINDSCFAGTGLTSIDFSNTNVKIIRQKAFEGAQLASVNFEGINRIDYMAFKDNNLTELYLPKSINYLQAYLFAGNTNLKKATIAYDTMTSGTVLHFFVVLDNDGPVTKGIEEINVIAPYAAGEEYSDTHVSYLDYKYKYHGETQAYMPNCDYFPSNCNSRYAAMVDYGYDAYTPYNQYGKYGNMYGGFTSLGNPSKIEVDYAKVDEKKNVVAPAYFGNLPALKRITIGEGFDFIGSAAFYKWSKAGDNVSNGIPRKTATATGDFLKLPQSLKGVGNHAFDHAFEEYFDLTISNNIEFIGSGAFKNVYFFDTDINFPNLVAIGDFAFEKTRIRNIYLHDKTKYLGIRSFADCPYINDITFDFDVFNPDPTKVYVAWAQPKRTSDPRRESGMFEFITEFGSSKPWAIDESDVETYGIRRAENALFNIKFGKITFTEKNVSQLPNGYNNCWQSSTCPGGSWGDSAYNAFFADMAADKIDISKTAWKTLSSHMFVNAEIDEIVLPEHLEIIPGSSFAGTLVKEELILPDSVKLIGDAAFNFGYRTNYGVRYSKEQSIKITKLPASLEYVGNDAFYDDYNLTADLNSPNLKYVNVRAFRNTRLRDVTLPSSMKVLRAAAFTNIPTLRNITIDFDLGKNNPDYHEIAREEYPQTLLDYAGDNYLQLVTASISAYRNSIDYLPEIHTFYDYFSQSIVEDELDDNENIVSYGQTEAGDHFAKVTFTQNATSELSEYGDGFFSGIDFDEVDLSKVGWKHILKNASYAFSNSEIGTLKLPEGLETIETGSFANAEIETPITWPSTIKNIGASAFHEAEATTTNALPEGLETIGSGAFYAADLTDNLVIPSTVTSIGESAFNAGSADVSYGTVTVKPDLTISSASDQLVHQLLWGNKVDKLIVESSQLVAYEKDNQAENQEFWHMPIKEVVITNLPTITEKAFDGCTSLEKADLSADSNLRAIKNSAFGGDEKLHTINFSPDIKDETVTIGQYAFEGTAFETMGDNSTDFDLTAANFDATTGYAFYGMPKLRSANIPNSFSHATVPAASFANDTDLEVVNIDYRTTDIKDDAFANDTKLARIFIWGNTVVEDTDLENYTAPDYYGHGGNANANREGDPALGLTIPETTDIYAYSVSPTEAYAGEPRDDLEGTFYPLDEVLYITTNDPKVQINEDNTDFDKTGVITYAMRRDGIILQSDSWGEYEGVSYPRSQNNINFEHQAEVTASNPAFGTVYDTPVPISELYVGNVNFQEIDFELIPDVEDENIRLINVIYTDGYTRGTPDTDIDPYSVGNNNPIIPDPIEDLIEDFTKTPVTLDKSIAIYASVITITTLAIILLAKQRSARR